MSRYRNPFTETARELPENVEPQVEEFADITYLGCSFESAPGGTQVFIDTEAIRQKLFEIHKKTDFIGGQILLSDFEIQSTEVAFKSRVIIESVWKPGKRFNPPEEVEIYDGNNLPESVYISNEVKKKARENSPLQWHPYLNIKVFDRELPEYLPIKWKKKLELADYINHRAQAKKDLSYHDDHVVILEQTFKLLILPVLEVHYVVRESNTRTFYFCTEDLKVYFTDVALQKKISDQELNKQMLLISSELAHLKLVGKTLTGLRRIKKISKRYGQSVRGEEYLNEFSENLKKVKRDQKKYYFTWLLICFGFSLFWIDGVSDILKFDFLLVMFLLGWQLARFLSYMFNGVFDQIVLSVFLVPLIYIFLMFSLAPSVISFSGYTPVSWVIPNYPLIGRLAFSGQFSNLEKYLTASLRTSRNHGVLAENIRNDNFVIKDSSGSEVTYSIRMGDQTWLASNLRLDTFQNGDPIPHAKSKEAWAMAAANKQPAWCYPFNSNLFGVQTGKLYNWYAVMDARGLAPKGWRISTYEDWQILDTFIGSDSAKKLIVEELWNSKSKDEEDNSFPLGRYRFLPVPGFHREQDGTFEEIPDASQCKWWAPRKTKNDKLYGIVLLYDFPNLKQDTFPEGKGLYVRCVKEM